MTARENNDLGYVLVVDDNPDNVDLLSRRLQRRGAEVDAVTSGQDALNHVAAQTYDAVLLDLMMPEMDGIETLTRLRADHDSTALPVIMVTAKDDSESVVQSLHAGANDYITKPIDFPVLLARLKSVVARKRAEDRLRDINSELEARVRDRTAELESAVERFRLLLNSVSEGIFGIDTSGTITFANGRAAELLQRELSDLEGADYFDLFCYLDGQGQQASRDACPIGRAVRHGNRDMNANHEFCRPDGKTFPVAYGVTPIEEGDRITGAVVSFQDVSDRRVMEMQLRQASKMEAVGRMTGGVAHDFNNLLTVIMGNLELLAPALQGDSKVADRVEKVRKAASSASELTKRLLAFSRQQVLKTEAVDVNDIIADLDHLLQRTLGEDVELKIDLQPDLAAALTDGNQIENAVLNLCVNARDAMPDGGTLTVRTRAQTLDEDACRPVPDLRPGDYILIEVADTGTGIPPDIIDKIFEPFFTTKGEGKGTGLGLSTVYGFVRQTGGHLAIETAPGEGTTIRLWLPQAVGDEQAEASDTVDWGADLDGAGRKVLVVDDDEGVREVAVNVLRGAGFDVVEAASGMGGLIKASDHTDIVAVVSDVRMPGGMSGPQMVEKLLADLPQLKAIFVSGYAEKSQQKMAGKSIGDNFLGKPYTGAQLLSALGKVLAEGRPILGDVQHD